MGDTSSLDFMRSRKVFEINPDHEIIKGLNVSSQHAVGYLTCWSNLEVLKVAYILMIHCDNSVILDQVPLGCSILTNFNLQMQVACRNNPDDSEALKVLDVLFETAMISSGFTVSMLLFSISFNIIEFFYVLESLLLVCCLNLCFISGNMSMARPYLISFSQNRKKN